MAVSSAYSASEVFGGEGMSEMYRVKRVVDNTAPWGNPAGGNFGVDDASLIWTVKERPSINMLSFNSKYGQ
jgi:hypothetical protein